MDAEAVVRIWQRPILRYCRRRLETWPGGYHLAEDAAQEACLALALALPRYVAGETPLAAFVYRIAAHKVADAQRGCYASREDTAAELPDAAPELTDPVAGHILDTERLAHDFELLDRLLGVLPSDSARLLRLRAQGLSAEQVGRRVGMKANAVRVAQHRALNVLRERVR